MKKIFVDYDSTLNNLDDAWVKWVNEKYNQNITRSHIEHWDWMEDYFGIEANDFFKDPKIYSDDVIVPISGSQNFMFSLCYEYGAENVFIITASANGTTNSKDNHIVEYYNGFGFLRENIIHTHDKHEYTKEGIIIDDAVHQVESHCINNNKLGIVFDRDGLNGWSKPCNVDNLFNHNVRNNLRFAYSYDMILNILENHMED